MKIIITEEMKFRQIVVEYAINHDNNVAAARRYGTSRQQVQRLRRKYDGTVQSLANRSGRPHRHPNAHTKEEIELIKRKYRHYSHEGLAQVYRTCIDSRYARSYELMCKQIKKFKEFKEYKKPKCVSYPKSKYQP